MPATAQYGAAVLFPYNSCLNPAVSFPLLHSTFSVPPSFPDTVTDDGNSEDSQVTEESDESGVDDAGAAESDSGEEENSEETTSDGNA